MTATATACGLKPALKIIAGKWKATIIWELHLAPTRFGVLRRRIGPISEKVLAQQLRELEDDGIVRREAFDKAVLRVEYSLTAEGLALNDAVHGLAVWGTRHVSARAPAPLTPEYAQTK